VRPTRLLAFTTRGSQLYSAVRYQVGDALLFGPETRGLPAEVLARLPPEHQVRLPLRPNNRSLNLSNAVAVAVYEAWRQLGFVGGK
jgi:tRNA (cytidine/uridine-2'-O-)-methyltransferase